MHDQSLSSWEHEHVFLGESHERDERRTWVVVALASAMMIGEIIAGTMFGSMALVADGWHMSTHVAVLTIAALAYNFARRHARDPRFSFGTGKFGELAAFSSALLLALVALMIGYESVVRLLWPVDIRFGEAVLVAGVGLCVNLVSSWLLFDEHHHHGHDHGAARDHGDHDDDHHDHHDSHGHAGHGGHDTNVRAAYMHVMADALTSVLAIFALGAGWLFGWTALDLLMGLVGALVMARWAFGLLRTARAALLDVVPDQRLSQTVRQRLEVGSDRVSDLHVWRLGPGHMAVSASVVAADPQPPAAYKQHLAGIPGLSHVTVEVQPCVTTRA